MSDIRQVRSQGVVRVIGGGIRSSLWCKNSMKKRQLLEKSLWNMGVPSGC